ncbi:MAG: DUF1351 domain-containing protein [Clostridia bacterium]
MQELITIKQLPQIEEHLKELSIEIDKKVENAKSLVCTEENVKAIKQIRADLNKEFKEVEQQRKTVKEKILESYMQFEGVYKTYISDKYKEADGELKNKIDTTEEELRARKEQEVRDYFEEYKQSLFIDFIKFEDAKIKVGLSDSKTSLKKQVKDFIDRVNTDLATIMLQEHKEEILVEYKQNGYVLSTAISTVINRIKAVEETKRKQEELKQKQLEEAQRIADENIKIQTEATKQALDNFRVTEQEVLQAPVIEEKQEEVLTLKFTVRGTRTKLRALKEFLVNGGYEYE